MAALKCALLELNVLRFVGSSLLRALGQCVGYPLWFLVPVVGDWTLRKRDRISRWRDVSAKTAGVIEIGILEMWSCPWHCC